MQTPENEQDNALLTAPLSQIIDHVIEKHHKFVYSQAESIENLIQQLVSANPDNKSVDELRLLNRTITSELFDHMRKEEEVLFPAIISLERAAEIRKADGKLLPFKIANRLRLLILEDEGTGYLLRNLRQGLLTYQPSPQAESIYKQLSDAIASFESDLKRHIYIENSILFPRAIEIEKALLGD